MKKRLIAALAAGAMTFSLAGALPPEMFSGIVAARAFSFEAPENSRELMKNTGWSYSLDETYDLGEFTSLHRLNIGGNEWKDYCDLGEMLFRVRISSTPNGIDFSDFNVCFYTSEDVSVGFEYGTVYEFDENGEAEFTFKADPGRYKPDTVLSECGICFRMKDEAIPKTKGINYENDGDLVLDVLGYALDYDIEKEFEFYDIDAEHVGIKKYLNGFSKVFVPSEFGGKTVSEIGEGAFEDNDYISRVELPKTVTAIGPRAFKGCTDLWDINLSGVETIGESAFRNDGSVETVIDLENAVTVGDSAFEGCSCLENVKFGSKLKSVGDRAFYNCKQASYEEGKLVFYRLGGVDYFELPESLTDIGDKAFGYSTAWNNELEVEKTIEFPDSSVDTPLKSYVPDWGGTAGISTQVVWTDYILDQLGLDNWDYCEWLKTITSISYDIEVTKAEPKGHWMAQAYIQNRSGDFDWLNDHDPETGEDGPGCVVREETGSANVNWKGDKRTFKDLPIYNSSRYSEIPFLGADVSAIALNDTVDEEGSLKFNITNAKITYKKTGDYEEVKTPLLIYAKEGSAAYKYAQENGFLPDVDDGLEFEHLDNVKIFAEGVLDFKLDNSTYDHSNRVVLFSSPEGLSEEQLKELRSISYQMHISKITSGHTPDCFTGGFYFKYTSSEVSGTYSYISDFSGRDIYNSAGPEYNDRKITEIGLLFEISYGKEDVISTLDEIPAEGTVKYRLYRELDSDDLYEFEDIDEDSVRLKKLKTDVLPYISDSIYTPYQYNDKYVTEIGDNAFAGIDKIKSVSISDSVKKIGAGAFKNCTNLCGIEGAFDVTEIGEEAFMNCTSLNSSSGLYDDLISVGEKAFFNTCSDFNAETGVPETFFSMYLPSMVTSLGEKSFGYYYNEVTETEEKIPNFSLEYDEGSAAEEYLMDNGFIARPFVFPEVKGKLINSYNDYDFSFTGENDAETTFYITDGSWVELKKYDKLIVQIKLDIEYGKLLPEDLSASICTRFYDDEDEYTENYTSGEFFPEDGYLYMEVPVTAENLNPNEIGYVDQMSLSIKLDPDKLDKVSEEEPSGIRASYRVYGYYDRYDFPEKEGEVLDEDLFMVSKNDYDEHSAYEDRTVKWGLSWQELYSYNKLTAQVYAQSNDGSEWDPSSLKCRIELRDGIGQSYYSGYLYPAANGYNEIEFPLPDELLYSIKSNWIETISLEFEAEDENDTPLSIQYKVTGTKKPFDLDHFKGRCEVRFGSKDSYETVGYQLVLLDDDYSWDDVFNNGHVRLTAKVVSEDEYIKPEDICVLPFTMGYNGDWQSHAARSFDKDGNLELEFNMKPEDYNPQNDPSFYYFGLQFNLDNSKHSYCSDSNPRYVTVEYEVTKTPMTEYPASEDGKLTVELYNSAPAQSVKIFDTPMEWEQFYSRKHVKVSGKLEHIPEGLTAEDFAIRLCASDNTWSGSYVDGGIDANGNLTVEADLTAENFNKNGGELLNSFEFDVWADGNKIKANNINDYAIFSYTVEFEEENTVERKDNGEFIYDLYPDGTIILVDCLTYGNIVIPAEIDGHPVVQIGANMFKENKNIEGVTFESPSNVTKIGNRAFENSSLSGIELPDSLEEIDSAAFAGCGRLKDITIPKSVTKIGPETFKESGVRNAVILSGITRIPDRMFEYTPLESVQFPENLKIIGASAFYNTALKTVIIPASVEEIEANAFSNNDELEAVIFDDASKAKLGIFAFSDCYSLRYVYLPEGITDIDSSSFKYSDPYCIVYEGSYAEEYINDKGLWAEVIDPEKPDYALLRYSWSDDNSECTASALKFRENVTVTETVKTESNEDPGDCCHEKAVVYTAKFENEIFEEIKEYDYLGEYGDHVRGEMVIKNEIPATDDEDGSYDEVWCCTVCGEVLESNHVIVPAGGETLIYDLGDVNRDGKVDLLDVTLLARYVAEWEGYGSQIDLDLADIDGADGITLVDATLLARCVAEWDGYQEKYYKKVQVGKQPRIDPKI